MKYLIKSWPVFIIVTAIDALGALLVWNFLASGFDLPAMTYGQLFVMLSIIKIIWLRAIEPLNQTLVEIKALQTFSEQNSTYKFGIIAKYVQSYIDGKAVSTPPEAESEKKE